MATSCFRQYTKHVHTWMHNLNKYNGYYIYWNDNTIYTMYKTRKHAHAHTYTHAWNYKQYQFLNKDLTDVVKMYW
jgi:hypothetical protein